MTAVLDASAILAYLQAEPGSDAVEAVLADGAVCGAANWSEVAQKVRSHGRDWHLARALLLTWNLEVTDVGIADAERAADRWQPGSSLSLADRLCLALADRLSATAWTADSTWGASQTVRQIR